ncbi:MAG: SpoIID/LytB domain-containing protein [bacterium]
MIKKTPIVLFAIIILVSFLILFDSVFINNKTKKVISVENKTEKEINEMINHAKISYYEGELEKAIGIYLEILNYNSENDLALKNLYFINKELGNTRAAIEHLKKIIKINPESLYWKYNLGVSLYLNNQFLEAEEVLSDVYKKYHSIRMAIQMNQKDNTEVNNDLNDINISELLNEKEFSLLCYYLGQIYYKNQEYKLAEKRYIEGITTSSGQVLNYIGLADYYNFVNNYEKAINNYKTALKKDSSLSFIYSKLAKIYDSLENNSNAIYYWKRSLETNNNTTIAKKRIKKLEKENPELLIKEEEEKKKKRNNVNWVTVKNYSLEEFEIPQVRVGIVENVDKVSFQSGANFIIKDYNNELLLDGKAKAEYIIEYNNNVYNIYENEELIKSINSSKSIRMEIFDPTSTFFLYDILYGHGYFWAGTEDRQYRGKMEMYPVSEDKFHIINLLNLEEYLFSVVPAEMPAWWPDEAIKAQIIAARSYALSNFDRHKNEGYNLCDTVHCAAYNGVKSETSKTNQLIIDTLGEVAISNGRPITAVFSSNSGGYSENSNEIWGFENSYLQGANNMLESDYEFPLEPYKLEKWLISEPESFSNNRTFSGSNIYRWIKVLDSQYLSDKYNFNEIIDFVIDGRTIGGTVKKINIIGDNSNKIIKGDNIRSALGGLKSNRFVMDKIYDENNKLLKIIFYGSGWGHHVGMDQTGAAGMAANGYEYKDIIKHFYDDISIEKMY